MLRMLTRPTKSLVSMDGLRASLLRKALDKNSRRDPDGNFVVIGHPKAVTPYSLGMLDRFLDHAARRGHTVVTFSEFIRMQGLS